MGGGLIQLVAMGTQDIFLTGNPEITFFKVVYRRHTNFSKECIEQIIPKTINANNNIECEITLPRNGDLIQEMYIKLEIKTLQSQLTGNFTGKIQLQGFGGDLRPWFQFYGSSNINFNIGDRIVIKDNDISWNNKVVLIKDNTYEVEFLSSIRQYIFQLKNITANSNEIPNYDNIFPNNPISRLNHTYHVIQASEDIKMVFARPKINISKDIHDIINNISISIGGQLIDKHYTDWFDIYNQLFENNIDYLNSMTMTNPNIDSYSTLFIPLRFWFNKNIGLALPLIALQYHEVKIHFNFKSIKNSKIKYIEVLKNSLMINYIYLDTNERRKFAQINHEYLIEQTQYIYEEQLNTNGYINIIFNHPIKSLFWTTNYSNILNNINIQLNGHDRFSKKKTNYFTIVQPYQHKLGHNKILNKNTREWININNINANQINSVQMYSFCLNPKEHQASGTCNFSRIDNARLYYNCIFPLNKNIHLFALNYNILRIMSGMGGLIYSN